MSYGKEAFPYSFTTVPCVIIQRIIKYYRLPYSYVRCLLVRCLRCVLDSCNGVSYVVQYLCAWTITMACT